MCLHNGEFTESEINGFYKTMKKLIKKDIKHKAVERTLQSAHY